ncbi:hypothetical protein ACHHYP_00587 [Achlya hypogyna]|uniref:WW domain-containing protein n=1 Tax=Achlya hypogyna TaxID=1202772 RepID=A0A1V9ZUD9_ACHHY|nr:hypothetical protein ACHHYP_00587 [Achlya hypogyna]
MPILYDGSARPCSREDVVNTEPNGTVKRAPGFLDADALRHLLPRAPHRTQQRKPQANSDKVTTMPPIVKGALSTANDARWRRQKFSSNAQLRSRLRYELTGAKDASILEDHVRWIKNNVPVRSLPKLKISDRTKITSLTDVFERLIRHRIQAAFNLWHASVVAAIQSEALDAFTRSNALGSLQCIWERSWLANRNAFFHRWALHSACAKAQERHAAAAEIQRMIRRFSHRRTLSTKRQDRAVCTLQRNMRRHYFRRHFRSFLLDARRHRAARAIQHAFATHRIYVAYVRRRRRWLEEDAAICLQRWLRTSVYRKQWLLRRAKAELATEATIAIQRAIRAHLARALFRRARHYKYARRIQLAYRNHRQASGQRLCQSRAALQTLFLSLMHTMAATVLQAMARRGIAVRVVQARRRQRVAVIVLQCAWRQCLARQVRTQMLQQYRFQQWMAASILQHTYRAYRERRLFRLAILKSCVQQHLFRERYSWHIRMSASAVIANTWRRHVRHVAYLAARQRCATEILQRVWRQTRTVRAFKRHVRSRLERERTRQFIAKMKRVALEALLARHNQAARRIQAAWAASRGRLAQYLRKQARLAEQARRRDAAVAIQRFLRSRRDRHKSKQRLAQGLAMIALQARARDAAATRIQRYYRGRQATRLGRVMLAQFKLRQQNLARRRKRQEIIAAFLQETSAARADEMAQMTAVEANHAKIEAAMARAAAEAAEARRLRIEASKNKPRPAPRAFKPKKKKSPESKAGHEWIEAWDETEQRKYYYNSLTGESTWTLE